MATASHKLVSYRRCSLLLHLQLNVNTLWQCVFGISGSGKTSLVLKYLGDTEHDCEYIFLGMEI